MPQRKTLTLGAAVLAAGLLSLAATATGANPNGGAVVTVVVNGNIAAAAVPIDGTYKSGTVTYGGATYACSAGNLAGTVNRGPVAPAPELSLSTFNLTCNSVYGAGRDTTISLSSGCIITTKLPDTPIPNPLGVVPNVHGGTVDTGVGAKFSRVDGLTTMPSPCNVVISTAMIPCSAQIKGTALTYFDEAITNPGGVNHQELIINDLTGLSFLNQNAGCFGLLAGVIKFNNITFNVKVTSGTTTGIDFRQT